MQLYRENITGWVSIAESGIPRFKIADVKPTFLLMNANIDFVLFDSIENLYEAMYHVEIAEIAGVEYLITPKYVRSLIGAKFSVWSSHTDAEKLIFCKLMMGEKIDRIAYMESLYSGEGLTKVDYLDRAYCCEMIEPIGNVIT